MRLIRLGRGVRAFGAVCSVVGVLLFCAQGAAALTACETPSPTIDEVTLKEVTMAGVAVEAQINPQGTEATYEFLMVWRTVSASERGERIRGTMPAQGGRISAATGDVNVNAFLSGLQPGFTYWYEVVAANLGGEARDQAPPFAYFNPNWNSNGLLSGPPYVPPDRTGCDDESVALGAARTVQEQREKEAAAKSEEEAAAAAKQLATEPSGVAAPAERCVVPDLRGDRLRVARAAILRAHCRLGRVRRPRRYRGALVVTGQSPSHGTKLLTAGTVTLTLGAAHERLLRHRHSASRV
jgi:hypothetical protein